MRRILVLLTVGIVTSLVATGAPAHASEPVHEWVPIDDAFTFDDCGFVVQEHDIATLHLISWYDASGVRQRQLVLAPGARITWTNTETGASVTTANPFVVHKTDNADDSATIAFTGLSFAIPGGGQAYVDSGRELIVFSPDTGVQPLSSVGPSATCARRSRRRSARGATVMTKRMRVALRTPPAGSRRPLGPRAG
jgi:hypothetical protein